MISVLMALTLLNPPVQGKAISVNELIASFDTEAVRHTATPTLGKTIVYLHAPEASKETIKEKLATAMAADWKRTKSGFRLERSETHHADLKAKEAALRASAIRKYQDGLRKKISDGDTPEKRMTAALQSLVRFQDKYRNSRPTSFKPDTELPVDWLLFELVADPGADELAKSDLREFNALATAPVGKQRPLPRKSIAALDQFRSDRREFADFARTIRDTTAGGPLFDWIDKRVASASNQSPIAKAIFQYGRSRETAFAGIWLYGDDGEVLDTATLWIPIAGPPESRIVIPPGATAKLTKTQSAFVERAYGYTFVKNPKPAAIDEILGIEPLSCTEPLFLEIASDEAKPLLAVLDDRLVETVGALGGDTKRVSQFVRDSEDRALMDRVGSDDWLILRPRYLLDSEHTRLNRSALVKFLEETKKAGFVQIKDHCALMAASGVQPNQACVNSVFKLLDRNGYVLVQQRGPADSLPCEIACDVLRLRGWKIDAAIELPVASLSPLARASIDAWARRGVASLEPCDGFKFSMLERNADQALPRGFRTDSVLRIVPFEQEFVGLVDPFPGPMTAENLAYTIAGSGKSPAEFLAGKFQFGTRRGLRIEALVCPGLRALDEFVEAADDVRALEGYSALPEAFRTDLERRYAVARKEVAGG